MPVRPLSRSFAARNQPKRRPPDRRAVRTAFFVRSALGCRWMRHFECGGFAGSAVRSGDGRILACRSVLGSSPRRKPFLSTSGGYAPGIRPGDFAASLTFRIVAKPCTMFGIPSGRDFSCFGSGRPSFRKRMRRRFGCRAHCDVRKRRALFSGRRGRVVSGQDREDRRCGWVSFS